MKKKNEITFGLKTSPVQSHGHLSQSVTCLHDSIANVDIIVTQYIETTEKKSRSYQTRRDLVLQLNGKNLIK